jgi:hypothetical protein
LGAGIRREGLDDLFTVIVGVLTVPPDYLIFFMYLNQVAWSVGLDLFAVLD